LGRPCIYIILIQVPDPIRLSFNRHGRGDTSNVSSEQVANAMRQCIAVLVQVRCKTGPILNNGRQMLVSDYVYGRFYNITDNFGRMRPGAQLQGRLSM
jgi:hypothetical protein